MTLVQKFTDKYGINPIKLVEDANLKNFGLAKTLKLQKLLEVYIEDKNLNIEVNNDFLKDLVESFAEAGEKFPENVKASVDTGTKFEVPNQMSGVPKSKGTLENFKDIVGTDDLRPIMMGVYVSDDGFIVGTDAHKLVKQKNNGLLSQTDYAGKIIDLSKYIKSKGKLIDFIDGVYPKYDAVIPRENPYEDRHLSTYAFYNYVKSSLDVKRLVEAEIFNVNFNLMTGTSGETTMFSFAYHVLFDSLNFAMLNGWDFFTLRYSEPNRAVVFDFDGDNIILVMPIIDSYGSSASGGSTGTIPLTTEEVQEKYRLGLTNQKKPAKAPKKPTVSAPASSEPFKEYKGDYDEEDTTYVLRKDIESITLTNGEVLGKNDVVHGFYRVNKKMAHGGNLGKSGTKTYKLRAEGLNDFMAFLQNDMYFKIKSFTVEITGFPDVVVTFETDLSLSEIKEKLKGVPDSHVMLETVKPIKEYTGEREGSYAHGGSMYAGGGTLIAMEEREIQNFVGSLFNQAENKIENDGGMSLFVLSNSINAVKGSLSNPKFYLGVKKTSSSKPIYVVGSGYLSSEMLMYDSYKSDTRFLETESVNEARKFLTSKVENQILHLKSLGKMAHGGSMYEMGGRVGIPLDMVNQFKRIGLFVVSKDGRSGVIINESPKNSYNESDYTKSYIVKTNTGEEEIMARYLRVIDKKNNVGSTPSSHEIGDTVTFNSVLGGTKTGTIISIIGDEGFRIKTGDGFATVKKSAIV